MLSVTRARVRERNKNTDLRSGCGRFRGSEVAPRDCQVRDFVDGVVGGRLASSLRADATLTRGAIPHSVTCHSWETCALTVRNLGLRTEQRCAVFCVRLGHAMPRAYPAL